MSKQAHFLPASGLAAHRIDYKRELNPAQYQAVTATEGPVLVIAGAGSGKTRTLVYRLAYLVDQGVGPENILLLTFTRKAAREMLNRAAELLDRPLTQVMGGTFHSVCYHWLRRHGRLLGYPEGFTVMDRDDQGRLVADLKERLGLKSTAGPFPRKETLADILSAAVNKNLSLGAVLARDYPQFLELRPHLERLAAVYGEEKRRQGLMDYDDLLVEGRRLLCDHEEVRRSLSERYRYIMVDEYQDTNHLQAELVKLLAFTHQNVMAVGDDCQSIYSFRGADFRNIMDFPALFPGTRIVKLEENYRSTQPILDLANAVIARAREKYTKCLFSRQADGLKPGLYQPASENEQSRLVISLIQDLHRQGTPLSRMAVLFRAAYHSFDLEIELTREGLPYMKFGGFKFMESAHIKDLLAYLRVVANPRDTLSWARLLQLQPGVGRQTAVRFTGGIREGFTLEAAIAALQQHRQKALKELAQVLSEINSSSQTLLSRLNAALSHYEPLMRGRFDDYPKRARDLEHLLTITARYREIRSFLNDLSLDPPTSLADITIPSHDFLTLSTVHSAKGLEWDAVFIIWAAEGRFPGGFSLENEANEEEERRLMYVGITRAKRHLAVIFPREGYNRMYGYTLNFPSRFLAGLPQAILEPRRVKVGEP
ncbi:MAG: ATP-dependent helicase [Desulfobaccales bacterium]